MHAVVRRYLPEWRVRAGSVDMLRANAFPSDYSQLCLGTKIPAPWSSPTSASSRPRGMTTWRAGCGESRTCSS